MGSSIAKEMVSQQKAVQEEMMAKQQQSMQDSQERMRRTQIAFQVGMMRERSNWLMGTLGLGYTGAALFAIKNKHLPPAAIAPLLIGTIFTAYTVDMGYFNKLDRINKMIEEDILKEDHWFVPLDPRTKRS